MCIIDCLEQTSCALSNNVVCYGWFNRIREAPYQHDPFLLWYMAMKLPAWLVPLLMASGVIPANRYTLLTLVWFRQVVMDRHTLLSSGSVLSLDRSHTEYAYSAVK